MTIEAYSPPVSENNGREIPGQRILNGDRLGWVFEESLGASVVEVRGERWSGKSHLLSKLSREAVGRGWTVASGNGAAQSLCGVPFGVFVDALDDVLAGDGVDRPDERPGAQEQWLSAIFPAMSRGLPQGISGDPVGKYQAFRAVRALLESLGSAGGLLLTLDDMHWADPASLELLAHLLRNPPAGAVVIALAHRPRQADHTLQGLLNRAVMEGRAHRLSPPRLSEEGVLAVLPGDLSRAQCELMLAESGRNPGLLKAFASARSVFGRPGDAPPALPLDVLTESLRDFRALSGLGRLVVRSAAVLGDPFDPDALKEVSQVTGEELHAAIDELMREDLLHADALSRRLRFRNPLLRAAAYQSAGPGWRLGAHDRAARLLAARGSGPLQLARHLGHSAAMGDGDGVRVLREAAAAHLWADPGQAAAWARTAMDLGGRGNDAGRERLLLGSAMILCGRLEDGLTMLEAPPVPVPVEEPSAGRADAARWRALALQFLGRHDAADEELAAALDAVGPECSEHHALLMAARLGNALASGRSLPDNEITVLLGAADVLPDAARGRLYAMIATAAVQAGAPEHGELHAVAAARLLDQASDGDVVRHLDALFWLAGAESALGRGTVALEHYERGLRLAERRELGLYVPYFAAATAALELRNGDLQDAARHAACAEAAAAATDSGPLLATARALRAELDATPAGPSVPRSRSAIVGGAGAGAPAAGSEPLRSELGSLSKRELEIAVLVSSGRTNQQIARALAVSHKTVETHLGRIFKKLIVTSRAEVAAMVGRSNGSGQGFGADRMRGALSP